MCRTSHFASTVINRNCGTVRVARRGKKWCFTRLAIGRNRPVIYQSHRQPVGRCVSIRNRGREKEHASDKELPPERHERSGVEGIFLHLPYFFHYPKNGGLSAHHFVGQTIFTCRPPKQIASRLFAHGFRYLVRKEKYMVARIDLLIICKRDE